MLGNILGIVMKFCYDIVNNYGIAIVLFTLISKIVLLPISIWVQKNSIKMVQMQPYINKIKIKYFGDKDSIAEEESKLYKKYKYSPFASIIPLVIQIVLLLGLVQVINKPMTHLLNYNEKTTDKYVEVLVNNFKDTKPVNPKDSNIEVQVVKDVKKNPSKYYVADSKANVKKEDDLSFKFLGFDLSYVAASEKGAAYLIPILAGLSALILCIGQNKMNVLQKEQSNANKYGMLVLSVGLSLYLGTFVAAGVALYWIASNLFAVLQQWLLNIFINPKKYVNYEELEKTSKELKEMEAGSKVKRTREEIRKEKADYKKFFKVINKHLVFYSESNGFYKYYKAIIEYILENTNITIHYITSDYNDKIFELEKENPQIKAYYIGDRKLITLMMKMDADVVVMTMPDIENYHIKRSYVRKDIEYVYIPHGMDSQNMTLRDKALDHYDTIYVSGKHQRDEIVAQNKKYKLDRKVFDFGYPLLDDMIENYNASSNTKKEKTVLIAPSWQKDNIIDLNLNQVLDSLKGHDYKVIVRPHPQHVRHMNEKIEKLKEEYNNDKTVEIQTDFSSNDTVFNADLLITDWSSICYDYAFTTKKPVLFINTPTKIMNPNYKDIKVEPINIWCRGTIGKEVDLNDLDTIDKTVDSMLKSSKEYKKKIDDITKEYVYNLGTSGEKGALYIIKCIQEKVSGRSKK